MASYPKFQQIPPVIMDKVITKCEEKSYFRLQQACRDVHEFIKNSENICVHLSEYKFYECSREGSSFFLTAINMDASKWAQIPMQDVYGVRLVGELKVGRSHDEHMEEFNILLNILKQNRIKCVELGCYVVGWTIEQFTTVLKMLTPSKVRINTSRTDGFSSYYEQILKAKQVKEVSLVIGPEDFLLVASRFLTTFPVVSFYVHGPGLTDIGPAFEHCHTILQILHTDCPQNLREFYFSYLFRPNRYPTVNEIQEQLRNYNPRVQEYTEPVYTISALVDLPETLPSNAFCEIRFGPGGLATSATINYAMRGADGQAMTKFPMNRNRSS